MRCTDGCVSRSRHRHIVNESDGDATTCVRCGEAVCVACGRNGVDSGLTLCHACQNVVVELDALRRR